MPALSVCFNIYQFSAISFRWGPNTLDPRLVYEIRCDISFIRRALVNRNTENDTWKDHEISDQ
jgi:hypothetical protein